MGVPTSFFVTGLSINTRCVSRANFPSTSRSDSSARLFELSTRVARLGIALGRLGWMVETRLRASRSACIRGDSGKLPRIWMSLSVKSIESCGYRWQQHTPSARPRTSGRELVGEREGTYAGDTKVLNGGYSVSYFPTKTESISTLALP